MQERWIADRALLQQLMQQHPEWTQPELANMIGRSLGWVKKWVKRLREAPPGDTSVLFGKPFGRKTPYPQTDLVIEERILAIRDTPPENLKRTPGPKAILYYLPRDPHLQQSQERLPRSTRTIWEILRRNDRIVKPHRRKHKFLQRLLTDVYFYRVRRIISQETLAAERIPYDSSGASVASLLYALLTRLRAYGLSQLRQCFGQKTPAVFCCWIIDRIGKNNHP